MEQVTLTSLTKAFPAILHNPETQVMIFGILCFVGAWVVLTRLLQLIFALLWPLIFAAVIIVVIPNMSLESMTVWLAKQLMMIIEWSKDKYEELCDYGMYIKLYFKNTRRF